jgi:hypothetical protein
MYSSEHYIPQNLPQVYEQCAVMLFNRWDKMRGIPVPLEFRGRLRGAIQYLAWHLFNAEESAKAQPRHRIIRILADYLVAKRFDQDDALATAEQFVEFCTDRSWILTDVGATDAEPRYGFTHRTFLEYFAAEHLVRTHPTPDQLWQGLRPLVLAGQWDVVTQIALQLLDRNTDSGTDTLLHLAISDPPEKFYPRTLLKGFAARTLGYLHPGHDVITEIVATALAESLDGDIEDLFHYWIPIHRTEHWSIRDDALHAAMTHCSPGNAPAVWRVLTNLLSDQIELGQEMALLIGWSLPTLWRSTASLTMLSHDATQEFQRRHAAVFAAWRDNAGYAATLNPSVEPHRIVARFGPGPLYLGHFAVKGLYVPVVDRLLHWPRSADSASTSLSEMLMAAKRPWITEARWWDEFDQSDPPQAFTGRVESLISKEAPLSARALLWLPYLEAAAHQRFELNWLDRSPLPSQLTDARTQGAAPQELLRVLRDEDVTQEVRDFLISWVRREFDLLPPRADAS